MIGQSKFVGRVSEFKELTSYLDELVSEKGNVVFITGEAGVGKTRLVHELGDRAKELEIRFLSGRCLYSEGADPYLPFIECLKGISEEKKEMRGLPVGLMPLALPEEGKKEKRRLDPSELVREKDKMFENVTTLLLSMAKDEPIILFIDDLHWADNATIHLLYYIIRNTQQSRILIICCYRPEEIVAIEGKQHPLIDMLQRMSREITIKTIELGRLSYEETTEMVSSILRRKELPAGFSKLLYDETDGNPYYIEEVLKTLVDEGIINLRDPNWHEKLDIAQIKIPSTVKDVISRRIEKLSEDSVKVLGHASVIGQEFTFDVLVHTAEMPEEKVVECLDELIDAKLIYESFSKEKEIYKFTHTKIREVVYDSLSRPRKRYLHKKVGTVLEVLNAGKIADTIYTLVSTPDMWDKKMLELQKSNVIYALAHHFTQAMDLEKGTKYSIRAGDKASEIYALDEAIRYYKLALDSLGKLGESRDNKQLEIEVLLKLANCCDAKLLWDSALKYYEEAKKLCAEIGDGIKTAEVYRNIGHLLRRKGDVDRGIENIEKGLEISIEAGDNRGIADAYAGLGWISWKKGKYDKAIEYENMAIEYAEKTGDKTIIARICIDLGNVYGEIGDYDKGEEYYKKALDLLLGTTNFYEIARGYNNIGDIYLKKGEYEKGIEYFKKCLDISRKTENMRLVAYALSNIGECYARKNEVEEADEYLDEGLKIFKKIDEKQMISQIYMAYGIGYKGKKKWDKAKKYFDDSIKVLEEGKLDLPYTLCERYFEYALMYEECNDFKNFEFYLKKALDIAQQLGAKKLMEKAEEKLKKIHNSGIA